MTNRLIPSKISAMDHGNGNTIPRPLTNRERDFIIHYMEHGQPVAAYRLTHEDEAQGVKDQVIRKRAMRILNNPDVRLMLQEIDRDAMVYMGATRTRIVAEHVKLAFSNLFDIINIERALGGGYRIAIQDFEELPADIKACVKKFKMKSEVHTDDNDEVHTIQYMEIELWDKQKALADLSKMGGYLPQDERAAKQMTQNNIETQNNQFITTVNINCAPRVSPNEVPKADNK